MSHYLHLGCGPIRYPAPDGHAWINVDVEPSHDPDVVCDGRELRTRFQDDWFAGIFTCHALEHVPYGDGTIRFLKSCHRVLRPGGLIRIVVPDLMKVARKYVAGESLRDIYDGPYYTHKDCPAERFLYFMRGWQHTIVFDEPLLKSLMEEAGFRDVTRMPFGVSRVEAMNGVDRFESESMSLEAIK